MRPKADSHGLISASAGQNYSTKSRNYRSCSFNMLVCPFSYIHTQWQSTWTNVTG